MTTLIATSEGIYADTKLSGAGGGPSRANKVVRLTDGSLLGCAGTFNQLGMLQVALDAQIGGKPIVSLTEGSTLLNDLHAVRVMTDGSFLFYDNSVMPYEILDEVVFIGSGTPYAQAAIMLGHGIDEALQVAGRLDEGSNTDTCYYPLNEEEVQDGRA